MKLNKYLLLVITALSLCSASAVAQDIQNSSESNPGWLWTISGNGLSHQSYLLGTCHGDGHNFTNEEVYSITGLESALKDVKAVLFEGGLNPKKYEADSAKIAEQVSQTMKSLTNPGAESVMPEDVRYESLYDSVKHFKMVDRVLTGLAERLHVGEYQKKTPRYWSSWLVMMQLTQHSKDQRAVTSVDRFLFDEAQKKGLEIGYVEGGTAGISSFSVITNTFDTLSMKKQAEALYLLLENTSKSARVRQQKFYEGMTKAYLTNDTCQMESFWREGGFVPGSERTDESQKAITYDRNVAWIPVIKQNIAQRSCMIAVGCRHLLGTESVIALLRREGYTVEPVK